MSRELEFKTVNAERFSEPISNWFHSVVQVDQNPRFQLTKYPKRKLESD
jgi:hypothetical protein